MNTIRQSSDVCREMAEIRRDFREDVEDAVDSARDLANWRSYVRSQPWTCLAAAVAVGYLIVPPRLEIRSPDVATLKKLAKQNRLVVQANPEPTARGGWLGAAIALVGNMLLRESLALAGKQLGQAFARNEQHTPASQPRQRVAPS